MPFRKVGVSGGSLVQEVRIIDVGGQYATFFGSHRLLGLLQAGEDDGRNVCTCMDGIRKEV